MSDTAKNIVDSIRNILTKFAITDESKYDPDWIYYKVNQIAAELKVKQYSETGILDHTWLCSPFKLNMYRANWADDNSINCGCDVSKTTIPQTISLLSRDGNLDLGIYRLSSMCGKTQYYFRRMFQWGYTPPEHTNSLFKYYDRYNTVLFTNNPDANELLMTGLLLNPEDGYLVNSVPILSGSLVSGTVYLVKRGTVIYNSVVHLENTTFTANATTTFSGNGMVYLNSEIASYRDIDPYPASGEMIRQIEIEILTKEFRIEAGQLTDVRNDSVDDSNKVPAA